MNVNEYDLPLRRAEVPKSLPLSGRTACKTLPWFFHTTVVPATISIFFGLK